FGKGRVTGAAAETARLFEIGLCKTANRAALGRAPLFNFLRRADAEEQIRERKTSRVLDALFFRARVAEIHLLHLPLNDLSQEDGRVIAFTNVAQHFYTLDLLHAKTFNYQVYLAPFSSLSLLRIN